MHVKDEPSSDEWTNICNYFETAIQLRVPDYQQGMYLLQKKKLIDLLFRIDSDNET